MTPGARLRRLLRLCHVAEESDDPSAGRWRPLSSEELVDALRDDPDVSVNPQLVAVLDSLTQDRDEIPAPLRSALARLFRVSEAYFDDPAVAAREEARLVPRLLEDLGVAGAQLCRCPLSPSSRLVIWVGLLDVARYHARTDLPDGLS